MVCFPAFWSRVANFSYIYCVAGNLFRVDGDRGLVERLPRSVQVFVVGATSSTYCRFVTILQELVNLAPFVLDDGSIVTGECFLHVTFLACLFLNSQQAPNLPRAWS